MIMGFTTILGLAAPIGCGGKSPLGTDNAAEIVQEKEIMGDNSIENNNVVSLGDGTLGRGDNQVAVDDSTSDVHVQDIAHGNDRQSDHNNDDNNELAKNNSDSDSDTEDIDTKQDQMVIASDVCNITEFKNALMPCNELRGACHQPACDAFPACQEKPLYKDNCTEDNVCDMNAYVSAMERCYRDMGPVPMATGPGIWDPCKKGACKAIHTDIQENNSMKSCNIPDSWIKLCSGSGFPLAPEEADPCNDCGEYSPCPDNCIP